MALHLQKTKFTPAHVWCILACCFMFRLLFIACTFINPKTRRECEMCGTRKPIGSVMVSFFRQKIRRDMLLCVSLCCLLQDEVRRRDEKIRRAMLGVEELKHSGHTPILPPKPGSSPRNSSTTSNTTSTTTTSSTTTGKQQPNDAKSKGGHQFKRMVIEKLKFDQLARSHVSRNHP
jgi:hypothetical protein